MSLTDLESEVYERVLRDMGEEGDALRRVADMLTVARAGDETPSGHPDQAPCSIFLPGLRASAWWDPAKLPDVASLEAAAQIFSAELDGLLQRQVGFQHFDEGPEGFQATDTALGWNAFYFRWACRDVPENHKLCPRSTEVLRQLPNLGDQAWFSALKPGTHLEAHTGPSNVLLTVHLALRIPAGCSIRVGAETRSWDEGRCLVFDDSFEHEVWHHGTASRFILLLSVWHPDLTSAERRYFARVLQAVDEAYEQSGYASAVNRYRGALDGKEWWK